MKLFYKVNLGSTIALTAALVAFALTGWLRERELFEREVKHDHEVLGMSIRQLLGEVGKREGAAAALALAPLIDAEGLGVRVRVVPEAQKPEPGPWRYTYIPLDHTEPGRMLEIRESTDDERRYLAGSAERAVATLGVLVLVTSLVNAGMLEKLVVSPLRQLVAHARRVGAGQLRSRSGVETNDELGKLAAALDEMAAALEASMQQLTAEQQQRLAALEQLRHAERLSTLGRLSAGIAHELGTPLNVVLIRGRQIERAEVDATEARRCGRIVAEQAERMAGIVRQLLNYGRVRQLERTPTDLRALARSATELLHHAARHAKIELDVVGCMPVYATLDPREMEQVLLNLLTNAISASRPGGKVTVALDQQGAAVLLSVTDDGTGIKPEDLPHIFDPFFTTKPVGEGTGLGLSVCCGIIRDHGGRIEVSSEMGQGTTFAITLPASTPSMADEATIK